MIIDASVIELITVLLGPTGAAWIGVKASLNGTKAKVDNIEKAVDKLDSKVDALDEKLDDHIAEHRADRPAQ